MDKLIGGLVIGLTSFFAMAEETKKPNIIFIMGEDASAEHFGAYGNVAK